MACKGSAVRSRLPPPLTYCDGQLEHLPTVLVQFLTLFKPTTSLKLALFTSASFKSAPVKSAPVKSAWINSARFKLVFLRSDKPHFKWYDENNVGHYVDEIPGAYLDMPITLEHEVTKIEEHEKPKFSLVFAWGE